MNIVYSSNDNYARHLAASMVSVLENNSEEERIDVYILNIGLSADNISILRGLAEKYNREIHIVDLSDIKKRFNGEDVPVRSFSIEMYARLFLAESLPETEDRALWIDCDTIITGSINELYFCDIDNYAAAAVVDQPNFGVGILCEDAGIPYGKYYNSGVLLANLKKWREENISRKFVSYLLNINTDAMFPDQAVLNNILYNRIFTLPLKFNLVTPTLFLPYSKMLGKWGSPIYSESEYKSAKKNPVIIHYTNFRPWKKWCLHPLKKYYRRYVKLTPYKDVPLENDGLFKTVSGLMESVTAKIKAVLHI